METHWKNLQAHYDQVTKPTHLRTLLSSSERNERFTAQFKDVILDFTHEKLDVEGFSMLRQLVSDLDIKGKIEQMFTGVKINTTENRAVLHTALRAPKTSKVLLDGKNIITDIHEVLEAIDKFSSKIRKGQHVGATGKVLKNLVVIGIGGSYQSIEFIHQALRFNTECKAAAEGRTLRFLANVDPVDFFRVVEGLDAGETLFLVNSKTFTTAETMLNARTSRRWLIEQLAKAGVKDQKLIVQRHVCACSTNLEETGKFGISPENVFGFWDYVGGRFSVWSAIGALPLSIQYGYGTVSQFLHGGYSIDQHFRTAKFENNIPLLLGAIGFYRTTIQNMSSRTIVPYCQSLSKFVPHIQQLDMESNGKRVNLKGEPLNYSTAVVNFGEPGTNSQHTYFQLLHQGRVIPVQFIGFARSQAPLNHKTEVVSNHDELMSNFFSQPDALALGKTEQEVTKEQTKKELIGHKIFPGDRPSSSLLFLTQLNAYTCGQLLAIYQHRTSVQGFIWDIDSYDQWGVELGKVLAKKVRSIFSQSENKQSSSLLSLNSATRNLLEIYLSKKV